MMVRVAATLFCVALMLTVWAAVLPGQSLTQDEGRFLRIGTGPAPGATYRAGTAVSAAISHPVGLPPCAADGPCGLIGTAAVVEALDTTPSVVRALAEGTVELGVVPAPVAYAAWCADTISRFAQPVRGIGSLGNLYEEVVYLLVRPDSRVTRVEELRGRPVALGRSGTGHRIVATLILNAHGLNSTQVADAGLDPEEGLEVLLGHGAADAGAAVPEAVFLTSVRSDPRVLELVESGAARLIPIAGEGAARLLASRPYFHPVQLAPGGIGGAAGLETVGSYAQLLVADRLGGATAAELAQAVWRPANRAVMAAVSPTLPFTPSEAALVDLPLPLAAGSEATLGGDRTHATPVACVTRGG